MEIPIVKSILSANDQIAQQNREILDENRIFVVNVMASPGAGKTSLILRTVEALQGRQRIGVIEGDIASSVDADRVAAKGVPVVQINTGGQCHLDAPMIQNSLPELPLGDLDILMIENVGNLVCPVGFKLGEDLNVMIASVPEGDDKPYKYPGIFTAVDAVVINKVDLLPHLRYDVAAFRELIAGMNPRASVFEISCETGEGMEGWAEWLVAQREAKSKSR